MTSTLHGAPRVALGSWAFAFGPYAEAPWSFDRSVRYASDTGYDGVEINGFRPHPHDEDYDAVRATMLAGTIEGSGLGIAGYAPDLRSTPPRDVGIETYLARIRSIARFCLDAGVTTVRVDTITPAGVPDIRGGYDRLVTAWRASAELLAAHGISLNWEFEPGFWLNRPSQIVRLLEDVCHPNFGFLFDTSHAHTGAAYGARQGDDPEILDGGATELATMVRPWVRHLHLIDSDGSLHDGETSVHLPFGLGEIDFPAVLGALGSTATALPWWTVDYCFWPRTDVDAANGAATVRGLRDDLTARIQQGQP